MKNWFRNLGFEVDSRIKPLMDESTLLTREIQSLERKRANLWTQILEVRGETDPFIGRQLLVAELEEREEASRNHEYYAWDHRWDQWMTEEEKEEW